VANLTIRLRVDPATGKKDVIIDYQTDSDALPIEHEEEHRQLVEKLIEGGALKAGELGRIVVRREEEQRAPAPEQQQEQPQDQRVPQKQR
jgi:hypothetical protein